MVPLPIDRWLPQIVAGVRESRAVVIVAEPGAGKTTRVPPAILSAGLLAREHPNLVMLQPRRVAARAAAQRIADENNWSVGGEVGYHVRLDRRIGPRTRLRVLTEGILTRQLLNDPYLEGIGAVVLDEFHERSLHTDLAIALLNEVRQTVRDDLLLVVMSATLEAQPVARFLGGCPIIPVEGRRHPVRITYAGRSQDRAAERVVDAVTDVVNSPGNDAEPGDILVFLPGVEEIRRAGRLLESLAQRENLSVMPLHGTLPPEQQMQALRPADRRKIILATNIAETSLTIDGVTTVIDSGLARVAGYDPRRGLDHLELQRISKASATQRAGRAGRTAPGQCVRLWAASEDRDLPEFQTPEVHRVDLCQTILTLHAWGKPRAADFGWYEAPPAESIAAAERLLVMLGALQGESALALTPIGKRLAELPVHPRLGRLLLAAVDQGLLAEGAALAALLSEKDLLRDSMPRDRGPQDRPPQDVGSRDRGPRHAETQGPSDLLIRLDLLRQAEAAGFSPQLRERDIDPGAARHIARLRDELARVWGRIGRANPRRSSSADTDESILKLALLAYPDRVCRRRSSDPSAAAMVGGGGVRLAVESVVRQAEFFLAIDARQDQRSTRREALVRIASMIDALWLEELFPQSIRHERSVVFDEQRQRVVGSNSTWYRDLLIRRDTDAAVDPLKAQEVLAAALLPQAAELFAADETAARLLARLELLRAAMPEHPWPTFTQSDWAEMLFEAAAGKRTVEDIRRQPLAPFIKSRLVYPLDRLLDEHAPETLLVPSGNRIRLTYLPGQPPVLAVRLQELFGWTQTPRIAAGRVAVVLHLLAPNYRPVQITDDLQSFWTNTYFQVRKDLRTRYPKHAWPEEPLKAKAQAKGPPRR